MPGRGEFHIPSLDGIRGLAALTVFVSHAGLPNLIPGGFGVTVFFFLSGYLITTLLRMEFERTGTISFKRFYLRRIYRILPPMYIVMVAMLAIALLGWIPHQMSAEAVVAQLAHLTNYYVVAQPTELIPATSVMWSLAVEEHFYLLFPIALYFLFQRVEYRRIVVVLLSACCIVLAWRYVAILGLGLDDLYTNHATDTRIDSLLYGCILAVWCNPVLDAKRLRLSQTSGVLLLLASVAVLLVCFLYRDDVFRETLRYSLQGIALFGVFLCAVRYHEWMIFRWLDSKLMRGLGLISYSFYLVHVPCLDLLEEHTTLEGLALGVAAFVATTTTSTLMYVLVERHLARLRKRLHRDEAKAVTNDARDSLSRHAT